MLAKFCTKGFVNRFSFVPPVWKKAVVVAIFWLNLPKTKVHFLCKSYRNGDHLLKLFEVNPET